MYGSNKNKSQCASRIELTVAAAGIVMSLFSASAFAGVCAKEDTQVALDLIKAAKEQEWQPEEQNERAKLLQMRVVAAAEPNLEVRNARITAADKAMKDWEDSVKKKHARWAARTLAVYQSNVDTLSKFAISNSSGTNLVTTHIATAYAPMFIDCSSPETIKESLTGHSSAFTALGIDISASLPGTSPTLAQYGKQAVLRRDGGLFNIYFNFAGRDLEDTAFDPIGDDGHTKPNPRTRYVDRHYVANAATPNELLAYFTHGVGIRAIRTALAGDGMAGLATGYLGFGFDGPVLQSLDGNAGDPSAGWMSVELYGAINRMNSGTFNALFGAPTGSSSFRSAGVKMTIGLPGKFTVSLEQVKSFGTYARPNIGEVTMVTFGYNDGSAGKTSSGSDASGKDGGGGK